MFLFFSFLSMRPQITAPNAPSGGTPGITGQGQMNAVIIIIWFEQFCANLRQARLKRPGCGPQAVGSPSCFKQNSVSPGQNSAPQHLLSLMLISKCTVRIILDFLVHFLSFIIYWAVCHCECFTVQFVLFRWGRDVTRMPWVLCSMPRDCSRNWDGQVTMTTRLRPLLQPPPIGSSPWWDCRAVSSRWTSWRRLEITVTTPCVFSPPQKLRLTQRISPSHLTISPSNRRRHRVWTTTGHTPCCCRCYEWWFGCRGRREKTSDSGRSFCSIWRSGGWG